MGNPSKGTSGTFQKRKNTSGAKATELKTVSYFLAPGGCRPGSGPPAQQSPDTLKREKEFKFGCEGFSSEFDETRL